MGSENKYLSTGSGTHTCERCSPINFDNLRKKGFGRTRTLFTIHDLSQPLTDRNCPTCQMLQTAIDVHRSKYASARVCWHLAYCCTYSIGTVEFQYSIGDTYEALEPHLTVYDVEAMSRHLKTPHAIKRVDFERAKTWIDKCKGSHPGCTTHFSNMLKSLRVIDCVARSVISAPEDCVYIALSYVWGISDFATTRDPLRYLNSCHLLSKTVSVQL